MTNTYNNQSNLKHSFYIALHSKKHKTLKQIQNMQQAKQAERFESLMKETIHALKHARNLLGV